MEGTSRTFTRCSVFTDEPPADKKKWYKSESLKKYSV